MAVDREAGTVSFSAGLRYGELAEALEREGLALANLASLPHISVAGAVATATHGSGNAKGNLATSVASLELATSSGELLNLSRGDPDFDGLVVGLGALGAVTRLTLDVEPAYQVRQRVFEGLAWDALHERFDEITAAGDSVSVFTRWGEAVDQVWVKGRVTGDPEQVHDELFGAAAATVDRHPIIELDPVNCTRQLGVPGPWWDRLPHFRMGFVPSSGEELQSEYLIPRHHAAAAIRAVHALADVVRPLLQVSELRTVAADRLWMSPQHGQDTVAIHFTWHPDPVARRPRARRAGVRACPVPGATPLGQGLRGRRHHHHPPVRTPARLQAPGRPARPAGRVPQPLADEPRPRPHLTRVSS